MRSAATLGNFPFYLIPGQGMPSRCEVISPCCDRQQTKFCELAVLKFGARFVIAVMDCHL
ncbi:MAG: hypothetical protein H0V37_02750 [Chloroflexia bacterium]|jgi:hypothetical protein|nr:hypothetical protein [Chloroflexia bacterium]